MEFVPVSFCGRATAALYSQGTHQFEECLLPSLKTFATLLQVSRKTFWRLQHRCKCLEKLFGVCNIVASVSKNFLVFATPLQVPQKTFWCLQHRCKCLEKLFGVCNTVASVSINFSVFATPLQVPRKTFRCLQHCCKDFSRVCGAFEEAISFPQKQKSSR